jgi:hypothetical protein
MGIGEKFKGKKESALPIRVGGSYKFEFSSSMSFLSDRWIDPQVSRITGSFALVTYLGSTIPIGSIHVDVATGEAVGVVGVKLVPLA